MAPSLCTRFASPNLALANGGSAIKRGTNRDSRRQKTNSAPPLVPVHVWLRLWLVALDHWRISETISKELVLVQLLLTPELFFPGYSHHNGLTCRRTEGLQPRCWTSAGVKPKVEQRSRCRSDGGGTLKRLESCKEPHTGIIGKHS